MGATVHRPGEGELHAAGAASIVIKATGDDTAGTFFLSEVTVEPGFATVPPHRHAKIHDMFYVLEGTLTLLVGDEEGQLSAGGFACVQPGTTHTFFNRSDAPVRFLSATTPSGYENYMRDLARAAQDGPLTPQRIGAVAANYDIEIG